MNLTGTILGYDPGGNLNHGVALLSFEEGRLVNKRFTTLRDANEVIEEALSVHDLMAIGIDTLTCWNTGISGWRPADRWLKQQYKQITHSISSANSLYGSMCLNGMSVLIALREAKPNLIVSETHPKVIYYALAGEKYDYSASQETMDRFLSELFLTVIKTSNDHEWDATVSVYAVIQGLKGEWETDLHSLPSLEGERLIRPCGVTNYWWPINANCCD